MTELLTCRIGTHDFGVKVATIQQIVKTPPVSALTHPSGVISGVFSLRGRLVACLDPGLDDNTNNFCIVIQHEGDLYALPVCAVGDIVTLTHPVQPTPLTYSRSIRRIAPQIANDQRRVMGVIDISFLLSLEKEAPKGNPL